MVGTGRAFHSPLRGLGGCHNAVDSCQNRVANLIDEHLIAEAAGIALVELPDQFLRQPRRPFGRRPTVRFDCADCFSTAPSVAGPVQLLLLKSRTSRLFLLLQALFEDVSGVNQSRRRLLSIRQVMEKRLDLFSRPLDQVPSEERAPSIFQLVMEPMNQRVDLNHLLPCRPKTRIASMVGLDSRVESSSGHPPALERPQIGTPGAGPATSPANQNGFLLTVVVEHAFASRTLCPTPHRLVRNEHTFTQSKETDPHFFNKYGIQQTCGVLLVETSDILLAQTWGPFGRDDGI